MWDVQRSVSFGTLQDEELEALRPEQTTTDRVLRFSDRSLELRFATEIMDQSRRITWIGFAVWLVIAIFEFLAVEGHELALDADASSRVNAWGRVLLMLTCAGGLITVSRGWVTGESAVVFTIFVSAPDALLNNEYRVSHVLGGNYYERYGTHCGDDSKLLLFLLILCSTPVILAVRFHRACFIVPWTVAMYGVGSFTGYAPLPLNIHAALSAMYAGLATFMLVCCYRVEQERRRRWLENLTLRREAVLQAIELRKHQKWTAELEERLLALTGGTAGAPVKPASVDKASMGIGTVPLPGPLPVAPVEVADLEPNELLARKLSGVEADVGRLQKIADRVLEPSYGMFEFFEDCLATFPELALFLVPAGGAASSAASEVEYQRTVGALFALYWSLRLPLDGKEGFCYGVDEKWHIAGAVDELGHRSGRHKRDKFHEEMEWSTIQDLVDSSLQESAERRQAMFCLTAIHDIMKVPELRPRVSPKHAPYYGHKAGEVINDHDIALGYVLECYPDLLPSFRILSPSMQNVLAFTQGKLSFNHGWFVQAEAPPGPMLASFKAALHKAEPADLAFYFLHWLTDLAGACGRPLAGAEKFVLEFPRSVLTAFLWSIPFLQGLTRCSETEVMERYLVARMEASRLKAPPHSYDAIALMRLVVMAQTNGERVLSVFQELPLHAQSVLAAELSCTGLCGQTFARSPQLGGPALFVYYGPALLQRCTGPQDLRTALLMLAAVYCSARRLWPLSLAQADRWVSLDAAVLKASPELVGSGFLGSEGSLLIIERRGDQDGAVSLVDGTQLNALRQAAATFVAVEPAVSDAAGFCVVNV